MSLASYLLSWLHLLLSGPPKQGGNGSFTSKEEKGNTERASGTSSRKIMKDGEGGTELCRFYEHVASMPESLKNRYPGSIPLGSVKESSFLV